MKSFIVKLWSWFFGILRWISLFQIVRVLFPKIKEPGAVELWVFTNLMAAVVLLGLRDAYGWRWWEMLLIGYCAIRILEVVVYQVNVFLFDAYRAQKAGRTYELRGFRRLVILLLHNYVELIFWFAIIYRHFVSEFCVPAGSVDSFFQALSLSFNTMSTFGRSSALPKSFVAEILVLSQSVVGLFMALLIIARFIAIIPQPRTADELEKME
jgi:hypothetical protein